LEIDVNDFFEHAVDSICIIERAVCHVMSLWRCISTGQTFVPTSKFLNFPTCREGLTLGGGGRFYFPFLTISEENVSLHLLTRKAKYSGLFSKSAVVP
jgi:hypothetical protein